MSTKKPDDLTNSATPDNPPISTPTEVNPDRAANAAWEQQLTDLKEMTRSLMFAVQEVRVQNARNEALRSTIDEVKADVRAASQAILLAPSAATNPHATYPVEPSNKCAPCDCVSEKCCCFEIVISQVRAAKPQIEPADAGDIGPFINALEVQIYFTVDSIGYLWPGLASTFDLRADGLPGGPGPWVVIERPVNRVCIPKGATVTKQLRVEVREHDEGLERPIGLKDELGEALGSITLDCCASTIYPPMPIDISLVHGGEGRGMVQVAFYARRVCC